MLLHIKPHTQKGNRIYVIYLEKEVQNYFDRKKTILLFFSLHFFPYLSVYFRCCWNACACRLSALMNWRKGIKVWSRAVLLQTDVLRFDCFDYFLFLASEWLNTIENIHFSNRNAWNLYSLTFWNCISKLKLWFKCMLLICVTSL